MFIISWDGSRERVKFWRCVGEEVDLDTERRTYILRFPTAMARGIFLSELDARAAGFKQTLLELPPRIPLPGEK